MNVFRFFWNTHRWVGLTFAAVFALTAVTGLLLLLKKEFGYLQPPTHTGVPASIASFLTTDELWQHVKAQEHPDFRHVADIARIDVRIEKRVFKVRSRHNDTEMQIDASRGVVLHVATRRSDFLERLHDGSWISGAFKLFVMPLVALALLYLVFTGIWIWALPKLRRSKQRRASRERSDHDAGNSSV